MKNILMSFTFFAAIALTSISAAQADVKETHNAAAEHAIRSQLARYEQALNHSDTQEIMDLYAQDAVFMPQGYPTVIGIDNIRQAYDGIFKKIRLNVKFTIDEVKQFSADWAYARTRSSGTQIVLGNHKESAEGNQEIFIFHRTVDGVWKFYRYIFATTNTAG
ncbi:TPA: SgcJ/EcaC family oxidoreductase [Pseudomonas aeruginosa]|nr:SgcJ/EcaC family oxidoreductase [Pseudomonas aeruginosa]